MGCGQREFVKRQLVQICQEGVLMITSFNTIGIAENRHNVHDRHVYQHCSTMETAVVFSRSMRLFFPSASSPFWHARAIALD